MGQLHVLIMQHYGTFRSLDVNEHKTGRPCGSMSPQNLRILLAIAHGLVYILAFLFFAIVRLSDLVLRKVHVQHEICLELIQLV